MCRGEPRRTSSGRASGKRWTSRDNAKKGYNPERREVACIRGNEGRSSDHIRLPLRQEPGSGLFNGHKKGRHSARPSVA
jgi:hypothetical protein